LKKPYFKCAVAFFFLFFPHGISIGTRQQGISYNVPQPCTASLSGEYIRLVVQDCC